MSDEARHREILAELSEIGPCLPGSLVSHTRTCSTPGCHCHDDPSALHGPYRAWTRKVAGKTLTRLLSEHQLDDYQDLFDNHRRLKELVHELEALGLAIVEADPRWEHT
jgi:hypothetical protein